MTEPVAQQVYEAIVSGEKRRIIVHFVRDGEVYSGPILPDGTAFLGGTRMTIERFHEQFESLKARLVPHEELLLDYPDTEAA